MFLDGTLDRRIDEGVHLRISLPGEARLDGLKFSIGYAGMQHDFGAALLNGANHAAKSFGTEAARPCETQKIVR